MGGFLFLYKKLPARQGDIDEQERRSSQKALLVMGDVSKRRVDHRRKWRSEHTSRMHKNSAKACVERGNLLGISERTRGVPKSAVFCEHIQFYQLK